MTVQPCDPPEYDREADLEEQERFLLPPELRPSTHPFVEQDGTDECGTCSMPFAFGGLHPDEPVDPHPEPVEWWCRSCSHDRHAGPCPISVSPTRDVPCNCQERAA